MNPPAAESPKPARLMSLDAFRGATIASMMLVNNPGDWNAVYPPLLHSEWHGWTFTDLIFPFFLWIVGVALPLSTARRREQGQTRRDLFLHALRRAILIFAVGFLLNSFSYFIDGSLLRDGFLNWLLHYATTVRIPGVLQRIAVCYLATTVVFLLTDRTVQLARPLRSPGHSIPPLPQAEPVLVGSRAGEISAAALTAVAPPELEPAPAPAGAARVGALHGLRGQIVAIVLLLVIYWLLMALVPVPGVGRGSLAKEGNFAQYIDNLVLNGPVIGIHVWKTSRTWDPEGIVSTLPAIATCLFGILTGQLLRSNRRPGAKAAAMFALGLALLLLGQLMSLWLPINKSLWTSSYAVFMAGLANLCLAACYWLIDVRGWRRWARPFAIYGMNPLTVFVLAGVLGRLSIEIHIPAAAGQSVALKTFLYSKLCAPFASPDTAPFLGFLASPKNASLLWALLYVIGLYLVAYIMYRRKWLLKF